MKITLDTKNKTVLVEGGTYESPADFSQELENTLGEDVYSEWTLVVSKVNDTPYDSTGVPSLGAVTLSGSPADFK